MLALFLAALLPAPAAAKAPPDKLTVEGPGLDAPVAITDEAELSGFSPWTRDFIAWDRGLLTAPPPATQPYTVSFYLKDRKIYVLEYAPNPSRRPGYIYIPGPGHPAYRLNIGTIITGSSDRWDPNGKWHYATAEWDAVIQRALRAHGAIPPAPVSIARPAVATVGPGGADAAPPASTRHPSDGALPQLWAVAVTATGVLGTLAWVIWRRNQLRTN